MVIVEELLPWLKEVSLEGKNYLEAYECLATKLIGNAERFNGFAWDDGGRKSYEVME